MEVWTDKECIVESDEELTDDSHISDRDLDIQKEIA